LDAILHERRQKSEALVSLLLVLSIVSVPTVVTAPPPETEIVAVEDWTRQPLNSRGVPDTWTAHETIGGHPASDFTVVVVDGRRALRMGSHGEAAPLRPIRGSR
jgi:hypothetical protein